MPFAGDFDDSEVSEAELQDPNRDVMEREHRNDQRYERNKAEGGDHEH